MNQYSIRIIYLVILKQVQYVRHKYYFYLLKTIKNEKLNAKRTYNFRKAMLVGNLTYGSTRLFFTLNIVKKMKTIKTMPSLRLLFFILSLMSIGLCCTNNGGGCLTCITSSNTCGQCMDGYYLNVGNCLNCYTACMTCSQYFDCTSCFSSYYLDTLAKWCYKCPNGCVNCTSNNMCKNCSNGYYSNGTACLSCGSNCTSCQDLVGCSSCASSTYLQNHTCYACPGGCVTCTSQSSCQSCLGSYFLQSGACLPCPNSCNTCSSTISCSNCIGNYFLRGGVCYSCGSNCGSCSDNVGCTQCSLNGMYIQNQTCNFCPSSCTACSSGSACSQCSNGFFLNGTLCNACPNSCASCSDQVGCSACRSNFYLSGGICLSCGGYCSTCLSNSGCVACANANMYITNKSCYFCSVGCQACISSSTCTGCEQNYQLVNATCFANNLNNSPTNSVNIIAIVSGILSAIVLVILGVYIYKKCIKIASTGKKWKKVNYGHLSFDQNCKMCDLQPGAAVTSCGHIFHLTCLKEYLKDSRQCPVCSKRLARQITLVCQICHQFGIKGTLDNILRMKLKQPFICDDCHDCSIGL